MGTSRGRRRKGEEAESRGWLGIFWLPDFYKLSSEAGDVIYKMSSIHGCLYLIALSFLLFLPAFFPPALSSSPLFLPLPFLSSPLCSFSSNPPCLRFLIAWQLGGTLQFFIFTRQLSFFRTVFPGAQAKSARFPMTLAKPNVTSSALEHSNRSQGSACVPGNRS